MKKYGPWTYIKDCRPPEDETVLLLCVYPNGNEVRAVGHRFGRRYEIEWTDDHPEVSDIMFWMAMPAGPFKDNLRATSEMARARHDRGLRP